MEFADVVRKRKMVHVFEQRTVDAAVIDGLLDIARRAPSAGFSQGTELRREFGVPDDRTIIGVVGLGYAGHDAAPTGSAHSLSRRPLAEMVHRNGWS
jgi:nitroreductase